MTLTLDQQILTGLGLIILSFLLYPLLKYFASKAQMRGWLDVLKQEKKNNDKK